MHFDQKHKHLSVVKRTLYGSQLEIRKMHPIGLLDKLPSCGMRDEPSQVPFRFMNPPDLPPLQGECSGPVLISLAHYLHILYARSQAAGLLIMWGFLMFLNEVME